MSVYGRSTTDNKQVVNEVYFGRVEGLQEAQATLSLLRQKYVGAAQKYITTANSDPLKHKFEDQIAKQFGFKSCKLNIESAAIANAYTYPVSLILGKTGTEKVIKDKNGGFRFADNNMTLIINIYSYVIFNKVYTDEEIMAILLHEVGHNFSANASPFIMMHWMIKIVETISVCCLLLLTGRGLSLEEWNAFGKMFQPYRELIKILRDAVDRTVIGNVIFALIDFVKNIGSMISCSINTIYGIIPGTALAFLPKVILTTLMKIILGGFSLPAGYLDEKIADNFPTIYGYGPESSSGLTKLGQYADPSSSMVHKIPIIGWSYDLNMTILEWFGHIGDPHPTDTSRNKAQIAYLKKEMNKAGLSKQEIKLIEQDLERFNDFTTEIDQRIRKGSGTAVGDIFYKIGNSLKYGSDPREYIAQLIGDDNERMDRLGESAKLINHLNNITLI